MTSKDLTNLKELQVDKYIGIPYEVNGRSLSSIDCYGLVHLIYKEELGIDLPSFVEDGIDANRTQELIAQYKEGWEQTDSPKAGDVVIFKILGVDAHIALAISSTHFIHARQGQNSAIESFDNPRWKTRFVGSYKYSPKKSVVLNGIPHPLRTERITTAIPPGTNIIQLQDWIVKQYNVAESYKPLMHVFVNGVRIPDEMKESTIIQDNDVVEYRVLAQGGGDILRTALTIAVVIYAPQLAASIGSIGGVALTTATGALTTAGTLVSLGLTAVGMALVDAIAPVRIPSSNFGDPTNPGSAEQQLMVTGGSNQVTPYGSIPFVLGKVRLTPLLGANTYNLFKDQGKESYLRMLLVWGYGPLFVDETTLQIGELPLSNYQGVTQQTLTRITEPTAPQLAAFNDLYGTDITQVNSGVELTCDGVAGTTPVTPGPWLTATSTDGAAGDFTVAIHFPQGCRKIASKGSDAGKSFASPVEFQIEYKLASAGTWTNSGINYSVGTSPVKDAFTWTKSFTVNSSSENVQVRIRRITGTGNTAPVDEDYQWLFTSTLVNTTFSRNTTPAIDPLNCKIAKTALEIKASDQLNGQIEGINAIVWTYGKSWNGTAWVDGNINNPAALFRHVLEHPANPRRVMDAASKINLTQLQYWHEYCTAKGFTYNAVVGSQRSVLDILGDICAAGRASPAMVDGKWTVVIDEPKTNIVQHFTPHNSWGFEGAKGLPRIPDGLRVTFINEDKNYQEDETIVYAAGKSSANASLLESISVPGVTKLAQAQDHARWHMAQANLRPESYTLNTDIEYIVCNRGDRVKVMHDVPMWGLGSGRIKNRISSTVFELTEELSMQASVTYSLRVRGKSGSTTIRNTVPKLADGYYTQIELTVASTTNEIDNDDLFLFGELNQEAQDCLVIAIEPQDNKTARISLVDYGVTSTYNIFNDYLNYTNPIAFESQIALPPKLLIQSFGTKVPTITGIISDERVMQKIAAGVFAYNMQVSYTNAAELPATVSTVEFQWDYNAAIDAYGTRSKQVDYNLGSVTISDVDEGAVMKVRARYVGTDGRTGQWTAWTTHTIVGKTNPPSNVTGFAVAVDGTTGKLKLSWTTNTEVDIKAYEVRTDTLWGNTANLVFLGDATTCFAVPPAVGASVTYYIKALDYSSNYSATAASASYTTTAISNVTTATANFFDNSKSSAYVTLDWNNVSPIFGLSGYKVSYDAVTKFVASNTLLIMADWIGTRTFTIKTVDTNGNESTGYSFNVTKSLPNAPTSAIFSVDQATITLDWNDVPVTTLPIWGYEVRTDTNFGTAGYIFKGAASTCSLSSVDLVLGTNSFYIKSIDTDNNYSSAYYTSSYSVGLPPNVSTVDYIFADTSLTAATVTLTWNEVNPTFKLEGYEISYDAVVKVIQANSITLPANWIGERTFVIKTIDALGNKSTGYSKIATKNLPNPVTNFRSQVIDNTVMFYWDLPAVTSLPIDHVLLKKGATWATAVTIGEKKGGFTTQNETAAGTYTYWIAAVDTDDNESTPVSLTTAVAQPPDFVFFSQFDSTFSATKSNAVKDTNVNNLILPINTTQTFEQHFTSRSWTSPQDQVTAGYPIYAQPSEASGYYEETFDYGTVLTSSKVSIIYKGTIVATPIAISTNISVSANGSTWVDYIGVSEVFATAFRYVKVRLTATTSSATGVYNLESLSVKLDSKLLNDAGTVSCLSTDTLGTIVNFNKEFVDVTSITVSPQGTTAIIPVYDFRDSVDAATYSVVSNVCTVTLNSHGFVTGQKIRIGISTGSGVGGVYTITGTTTNTFTVSMTTANTSGNCSTYPESFRIYLFNTAGTRVSTTASWSLKGY